MTRELICIGCPMGCRLRVDEKLQVRGNACPRGEKYARQELTAPVRTVTAALRLDDATMLSVKTSAPVPRELVFSVMDAIRSAPSPERPVRMGQVIVSSVCGTKADIVATKELE